jgi:HTH-type transcriptional regulator / antitoxin HipB
MSHPDDQTVFFRAVDAPSFGAAIRDARKEASMTQQELANRIHSTRRTINRLEHGA